MSTPEDPTPDRSTILHRPLPSSDAGRPAGASGPVGEPAGEAAPAYDDRSTILRHPVTGPRATSRPIAAEPPAAPRVAPSAPPRAEPSANEPTPPHAATPNVGAATPGPAQGMTPGTRLPSRQLDPPVFNPRRTFRRWLLVSGGVLILLVAGGLGVLLTRSSIGRPSVARVRRTAAPPPVSVAPTLSISGVAASASPIGVLHCPSAAVVFSGRISTNGGPGTLIYQWRYPTGAPSAVVHLVVPAHQSTVLISLNYTFSGRGAFRGQVFLHVLAPDNVYSQPVPVTYACR